MSALRCLSQHLLSYLGFSYLGHRVSLHGCSSKAQLLLLTLDKGYLLTAAPPDLECGVAPLGPSTPTQPPLLGLGLLLMSLVAFLVAQMVKRLPTMRETRVQSLGQEYLLEKGMATHSSIFAFPLSPAKEGLKENQL